jgi:hypothetical protein
VTLHRDTSLPYRDRSVTPKCYADKPLLLHVKYRAGSFGRLLAEIEVSHPSVPLRQTVILRRDTSNPLREMEVSCPSVTLQQTVTLHRDTSIPLGGCEVSRRVWTSSVRPLALTLATTTLALEGRRVTASTVRSAPIEAQSGLGGSATASTIWGR